MELNFEPWYQDYLDELSAYSLAVSTMHVDQSTCAPKKGAARANKAMSVLMSEAFKKANDPAMVEKIRDYASRLPEGSLEKLEVTRRLEELDDRAAMPADVYARISREQFDAETVWKEAKNASDYEMFKPHLEKGIANMHETVRYSPRYVEGKVYDFMLNEYERGMDEKQYDEFFDVIKRELPPIIEKIKEKEAIDTSPIEQEVDIALQEKFAAAVLEFLGMDPGKVYLSTTEHPFTSFLTLDDARITTHYYPNRFLSAVLSTVHEYGHALFGLQVDPAFENTTLYSGIGSAAHESQSRFLENYIGRSETFWKALYPKLVETVPAFAEIPVEELVKMVNVSVPGLIRTEADELTYPLHILIRYELEKQMADNTMDYDKLPELWADKYEEYLKVRPANDKEGVLQDTHWSNGYIGYFPTYALGSAYAAQLYEVLESQLNVEELLANGQFEVIQNWLKDNIHHYGDSKSMKDIVEEVSGKPFDPMIYTNYLKDKYTKLYDLEWDD